MCSALPVIKTLETLPTHAVDRVKYPQGRWSQSFGHVGHGHAVSNRESSSQLSEHEGRWRKVVYG